MNIYHLLGSLTMQFNNCVIQKSQMQLIKTLFNVNCLKVKVANIVPLHCFIYYVSNLIYLFPYRNGFLCVNKDCFTIVLTINKKKNHCWSLKQGIVGKIITQTYVVIIIKVFNNTIFKELVKILPGSFEIIFKF